MATVVINLSGVQDDKILTELTFVVSATQGGTALDTILGTDARCTFGNTSANQATTAEITAVEVGTLADGDTIWIRCTDADGGVTDHSAIIESSTINTFGIKTLESNGSYLKSNNDFLIGTNYYVKFRLRDITGNSTSRVIYGNNIAENSTSFIGYKLTNETIRLTVAATTITYGTYFPIADDDLIEWVRVDDSIDFKINGVVKQTFDAAGYGTPSIKTLINAAYAVTPTVFGNAFIYDLDINGETFDFSEQTGEIANGSGSSSFTLYPGTGTSLEMWKTVI